MYIGIVKELNRRMISNLRRQSKSIEKDLARMEMALLGGQTETVYSNLTELSRKAEYICRGLRGALIHFHRDLQTAGILPPLLPYPKADDVDLTLENGCICIKMSAMLPYPTKGSVYYLHEQLQQALELFIIENKLPRPFFTERCAVVFLHHYGPAKEGEQLHLRDFDNVEHRCVTNVLAAHLLWGDSPKCMIAMDVLAPGDHNFTEIRIMPLSTFRSFVMSEKIEFKPE